MLINNGKSNYVDSLLKSNSVDHLGKTKLRYCKLCQLYVENQTMSIIWAETKLKHCKLCRSSGDNQTCRSSGETKLMYCKLCRSSVGDITMSIIYGNQTHVLQTMSIIWGIPNYVDHLGDTKLCRYLGDTKLMYCELCWSSRGTQTRWGKPNSWTVNKVDHLVDTKLMYCELCRSDGKTKLMSCNMLIIFEKPNLCTENHVDQQEIKLMCSKLCRSSVGNQTHLL